MSTVALLVLGTSFLGMLLLMRFDPDDFARLDTAATLFAQQFNTWQSVAPLIAITTLGGVSGILLLTTLAVFLSRRDSLQVARLISVVAGQALSVSFIKLSLERARPETVDWIGPIHSYSFPSGHATSTIALVGVVAVYMFARAKSRLHQAAIVLLAVLFVLSVGMSRIALGAHYASDVLAGYLLGGFWVAFVFTLQPPKKWRKQDTLSE